jgi:uncharacterized damage-inducible protein DinB
MNKINNMKNLIIGNLIEIKDLLNVLSNEHYNRKLEILSNASIGQHVRHILEFYHCLFESKDTNIVNYDARKRDLKLESDLNFALKSIDEIVDAILDIKSDYTVSFVANYSIEDEMTSTTMTSTLYRELAYNLEHSIHHQALIKVALNEMNIIDLVKTNFGFAPSTIRKNLLNVKKY